MGSGMLQVMNTTSYVQSHALLTTRQTQLQGNFATSLQQKAQAPSEDFAAQLQSLMEGSGSDTSATLGSQTTRPAPTAVATLTAVAVQQTQPTDSNASTTDTRPDGNAYLLRAGAELDTARSSVPNIRAFMDATGADFATASSTLYGVIGSNTDYRDWAAIMTSDNPLAAARAATGAMYSSDLPFSAADAKALSADAIKAQAGHFAWAEVDGRENLWLLDGNNTPLRQLSLSAPTLLKAARDFGFDTAPLAQLGEQLDALGVAYRPGQVYANSDHGVDFKAMANGQLGTRYDWTQDANVHLKGKSALLSLRANQALAVEMGIRNLLS